MAQTEKKGDSAPFKTEVKARPKRHQGLHSHKENPCSPPSPPQESNPPRHELDPCALRSPWRVSLAGAPGQHRPGVPCEVAVLPARPRATLMAHVTRLPCLGGCRLEWDVSTVTRFTCFSAEPSWFLVPRDNQIPTFLPDKTGIWLSSSRLSCHYRPVLQFSWSKFPKFDTIMIILLRVLYILTDLHVSSVHFGLPTGTHALFPPPVVRPLLRAGVGGSHISHLILRDDIYLTSLNLLFHCLLASIFVFARSAFNLIVIPL